jgi:hypothetical protein
VDEAPDGRLVSRSGTTTLDPMKFVRRALGAILAMVITATVMRVRGTGGTPPQHGGWRPLELPER